MQQTQERHDAQVLGRWKTEECLPVCLLPQAWWADWWAQAAKSQGKLRRLRLLCKGTAPPPITACEWLNRYATQKQKFLAPWKLCCQPGLPEMVLKLTLQCRCSGIFPLSHPSLLVLTLLVCWCLLVFAAQVSAPCVTETSRSSGHTPSRLTSSWRRQPAQVPPTWNFVTSQATSAAPASEGVN